MMLLTKEIKEQLQKQRPQANSTDPDCILKFFTPDAQWTWYCTEGKKEKYLVGGKEEWTFFGKVVSDMCPEGELGYTALSELMKVRGALGLPVERDMHWNPKPLSQCK